MIRWNYTLNIKEEWRQAKNDEISVQELAKIIAAKTKKFKLEDFDKEDLIFEFEEFSKDDSLDKDDFDELWNQYYDWADSRRVWVVIS